MTQFGVVIPNLGFKPSEYVNKYKKHKSCGNHAFMWGIDTWVK